VRQPHRDLNRPQTSHSSDLRGSGSPGWQPRALRWHATRAHFASNRIRTPARSRPACPRRPRLRFPHFPARLALRPSLPFPVSCHCCMYHSPSFVIGKKPSIILCLFTHAAISSTVMTTSLYSGPVPNRRRQNPQTAGGPQHLC